jgi:hypothetical protein
VQLSGIEINTNPAVTTTALTGSQDFRLPNNYARGTRLPEITGFQFCQSVDDPTNTTVTATLEAEIASVWTTIWSETTVGTHAAGEFIWTDVLFSDPLTVPETWFSYNLRVIFNSNTPTYTNRFRLLTNSAESDEDFLGNQYRSVVVRSSPDNVDTRTLNNAYWYSKPNPSKYAVESLYFDLGGVDGRDSVFDRVLLDPITPGVLFHVYYTSEGEPGTTRAEWENKLWTPVGQSFRATRREEHAMPSPITARYIKIEFSHLQGQYYSPGTFHGAIRYQKFPKWVMDHFLSDAGADNSLISRRVAVVYDALKLAYDHYVDDLKQIPDSPTTDAVNIFSTDVSDQVDVNTANRINMELKTYQSAPGTFAKSSDYLPGLYSSSIATNNYPIENVVRATANTVDVSNLNREALIVENNYPSMFFYLTCRHTYREVEATFTEDRAYFVGIRELAFTRDKYSVASDNEIYVDTLSDFANAFRNDLIIDNPRPISERIAAFARLKPRYYFQLSADYTDYTNLETSFADYQTTFFV